MAEDDILSRLMEAERSAKDLVREAEEEAARRVREARASAEASFKALWDERVRQLEKDFGAAKEAILAASAAELEAYARALETRPVDGAALAGVAREHFRRQA